jgi:hypothetical protein
MIGLLLIPVLTGCLAGQGRSFALTATASMKPTIRPAFTLFPSPSPPPPPSPTSTLLPVPTTSLGQPPALSLTTTCRTVMQGLRDLKKDLGLPQHFLSEPPVRTPQDFDPNQYFTVFTHLSLDRGYTLDYVYFLDDLGGKPVIYARRAGSPSFQSYAEFLQSYGEEVSGERSYGSLKHEGDYLEKIRPDGTPESYFEFAALALLGNQFYLWWHGLYNDTMILCEKSDLERIDQDLRDFDLTLPAKVAQRAQQIDFTPAVLVEEQSVTIRLVTFSKWGGFWEYVYVMDKANPAHLLDAQYNPLVEYDCGIAFYC